MGVTLIKKLGLGKVKMVNCMVCGKPIKPWFDMCYECHSIEKRSGTGKFAEPIQAGDFMKKMGIDGW